MLILGKSYAESPSLSPPIALSPPARKQKGLLSVLSITVPYPKSNTDRLHTDDTFDLLSIYLILYPTVQGQVGKRVERPGPVRNRTISIRYDTIGKGDYSVSPIQTQQDTCPTKTDLPLQGIVGSTYPCGIDFGIKGFGQCLDAP